MAQPEQKQKAGTLGTAANLLPSMSFTVWQTLLCIALGIFFVLWQIFPKLAPPLLSKAKPSFEEPLGTAFYISAQKAVGLESQPLTNLGCPLRCPSGWDLSFAPRSGPRLLSEEPDFRRLHGWDACYI